MPGSDASVAFVHVDLDNLWAIAECYGLTVEDSLHDYVYTDALPRFDRVFAEAGIRATFFVVGRDLENPQNVALLQSLQQAGHRFANHSYSHHLGFRALSSASLDEEIFRAEDAIVDKLSIKPIGFRAPGYGFSSSLIQALTKRGYAYDSSLMPGPYGFLFRTLDARLRAKADGSARRAYKTQYPLLRDARHSLAPFHIVNLAEYPVATAPLLRLPFQAGVCMRLGRRYFDALLASFAHAQYPFIFLLHAADLCDFKALPVPFFSNSPMFAQPIRKKMEFVQYALSQIQRQRPVAVLEQLLEAESAKAPSA